jgi:hypothetical protein
MLLCLFLLLVQANCSMLEPVKGEHMTNSTLMGGILSDPKKFVEEMANLDPTAVQTIISLLHGLLEGSKTSEEGLVTALSTLTGEADQLALAVVAAEDAVTAADDVLTAAKDAVTVAEGIKSNKQAVLAAAQTAHTAKVTEKALAQEEHDKQILGLNNEQQVLIDVIQMLGRLDDQRQRCADRENYEVGDGNGGSDFAERRLADVDTLQECLDLIVADGDANANGVTVSVSLTGETPTRGQCWVQLRLTRVNGAHSAWKTCTFGV